MVAIAEDPNLPWGDRLRLWRINIKAWSQQELVDHVVQLAYQTKEERGTRLDIRLVGKWENGGVQRPQGVYRRLLAQLGAPMPLAPATSAPVLTAKCPPNARVTISETTEDGSDGQSEDGEISVLRRDFIKLGSAVAVPGLIAGLSGDANLSAQNRVASEVTDELRRRIVRLRRLDNHLGGADTYQLYVSEANITARLLKDGSYSEAIQRELLSIYAEQAQQAGWSAFDAGWSAEASTLYQRSYAAATEAGDAGLAGNALAFRAYQLLGEGQPASEMTDRSIHTAEAGGAHPGVLALLYERGAWTYALAGDVEATARALGKAEAALAQESDNPPDYAAWVDETELQIMTGRCWTELRKPLRAVPALERALSKYGDYHARDKALYLSWLADSYIDAAEQERAIEVVEQAAALATDVASVRPRQRLRKVVSRLEHNSDLAALVSRLSDSIDPLNVRG